MLKGNSQFNVKIKSTRYRYSITGTVGDQSDILSITTSKDLGNPAGTFQITFTAKEDSEKRTWFDKIYPFDYVEIRLKGIVDTQLKIVMRGLVDVVEYSEDFSAGVPVRSVVVSGRDLGCLLTDFHVYCKPALGGQEAAKKIIGGPLIWEAIKKGVLIGNVEDIFRFIIDLWKKQVRLEIEDGRYVVDFLKWDVFPFFKANITSSFYLSDYEGPWWNAISNYQDKPFHEIFLYDTEDNTWLILRPSRLKDAQGNYPTVVNYLLDQKAHMYPDDFSITNEEKVSMRVEKKVSEVFTYYFVTPVFELLSKVAFESAAISSNRETPEASVNPYIALKKHLPSYIGKYGYRPKEVPTVYMDLDVGQLGNSKGKEYEGYLKSTFVKRGEEMNKVLVAWFLHNPLLLSGTVTIAGSNRVLIGTYMKDTNEGKEYYVEGVNHNFVVLQSYMTDLRLERGMPLEGLEGLDIGLGRASEEKFLFSSPSIVLTIKQLQTGVVK